MKKYPSCPKLDMWAKEAFNEIGVEIDNYDNSYAYFPRLFMQKVFWIPKAKNFDFCFIGSLMVDDATFAKRKIILEFIKNKFSDKSYLQFTDKKTKADYSPIGNFDKTMELDGFVPKEVDPKKRNYFDFKYYENMSNSKFVLCPPGDQKWSMRFYEAILCGAIPVVFEKDFFRTHEESQIGYKYYHCNDNLIYDEEIVRHNLKEFKKHHLLNVNYLINKSVSSPLILSTFNISTPAGIFPFKYRESSTGDNGVIEQIFINGEYNFSKFKKHTESLIRYSKLNEFNNKRNLVVDGGGNIGAFSVFSHFAFTNTHILSIEPEINNFLLLEENTKQFENQTNVLAALSSKDAFFCVCDQGMSNWGFVTKKVTCSDANLNIVQSLTFETILNKFSEMQPFIAKIDIEGSESELFSSDFDWINRFALIIIELHDWMFPFTGVSKSFINAISKFEFDFLVNGENILLFNRRIIGEI